MIKFGTDGWRAVIADDFTFDNVRKVAQAYVQFMKMKKKKGEIIVGYDTRFLSFEFARAFSEVLCGNGFKVRIFNQPLPTPCLCFGIKKYNLDGGIMVTASHNPPQFNGIKIKTSQAAPASPDETQKIEKLVDKFKPKVLHYQVAEKRGLIKETKLRQPYLKFLMSYVDFPRIKRQNLHIVHDSMYGTGNSLLEELFKNTKVKITSFRNEINPSFYGINPEPIPENIKPTMELMKKNNYDLCIITDGDADRIGAIAPGGRFLNPGWILSLLLIHFVKNRGQKGAVVKTISNSSLIEKIAAKYDLPLYETPVGFKHIAEIMLKQNVVIGGEESGGIGFKGYIPERDGLVSGLLLLEFMAYERKSINEIITEVEKEYGKFFYHRIDIYYPQSLKSKLFKKLSRKPFQEISGLKVIEIKDFDGVKFILEDGSWLLFRLSGTEPKLRIYCEANSRKKLNAILKFGRDFALGLK